MQIMRLPPIIMSYIIQIIHIIPNIPIRSVYALKYLDKEMGIDTGGPTVEWLLLLAGTHSSNGPYTVGAEKNMILVRYVRK